jgi:hypothetical protein
MACGSLSIVQLASLGGARTTAGGEYAVDNSVARAGRQALAATEYATPRQVQDFIHSAPDEWTRTIRAAGIPPQPLHAKG